MIKNVQINSIESMHSVGMIVDQQIKFSSKWDNNNTCTVCEK